MSGEELGSFDVAVYAASVDDLDSDTRFAKELGLDYPILADPTKGVAKAYGVIAPGDEYAARWTFIIGKDGKILDVVRQVNPAKHGKEVAARLAALGVPKRGGAPAPSASAAPSASGGAPTPSTSATPKPSK